MAGEPVLHQGGYEHADWVRHVQTLLSSHGQFIETDGAFGPATHAAVEEFQRDHGLQSDGIVGEHTWAALSDSAAPGGAASTAGGSQAAWGYGSWEPRYSEHDDTIEVFATNTGGSSVEHGQHSAQLTITGPHGHEISEATPLDPVYDGPAEPENGALHVKPGQVVARVGHGILTVTVTLPHELGGASDTFQIAAAFDPATDMAGMAHDHHATWGDLTAGATINEGRAHSIDLWCVAGGQDPIQGGIYTADVTVTAPDGQVRQYRNWVGEESDTYHPGDAIHVLVGDPRHFMGTGAGTYQITAVLPPELGGGYLQTYAIVG